MTEREKLIELIKGAFDKCCSVQCEGCEYEDEHISARWCQSRMFADFLIANGVTFATDTNVGGKWTRVKDRLPETHLRCLVYREGYNKMGGYMTMATFTPCYKGLEGDLMDGRQVWYDYDSECGDYELTNVTHWMPMPVPPMEG